MPDLDYGYNVSILQNATSDPSHVPTNQWQKKEVGGAWTNISGETGATYEVKEEDKAAKLRLEQDLGGTKAYSNELQVTSADPPALSSGYIGIRIKNNLRVRLWYDNPTAPINVYYKMNESDPWEFFEQVPAGLDFYWQEDFNAYFALESHNMTWCAFYGTHSNAEFDILPESDFSTCKELNNFLRDCKKFDGDLSWMNIPICTNLDYAFHNCNSISGEQYLNFATPALTTMEHCFENLNPSQQFTTGNWDLSNWDTSKVRNMGWAFRGLINFNNDSITGWDTSNVTNMSGMFLDATNFNQNLRGWCVEKIPTEPAGYLSDFATGSALTSVNKPNWGAPC